MFELLRYDFKVEKLVSYHILYAQHMDGIDKGSDCPYGAWEELARYDGDKRE